jgi:hypothetical protein
MASDMVDRAVGEETGSQWSKDARKLSYQLRAVAPILSRKLQ